MRDPASKLNSVFMQRYLHYQQRYYSQDHLYRWVIHLHQESDWKCLLVHYWVGPAQKVVHYWVVPVRPEHCSEDPETWVHYSQAHQEGCYQRILTLVVRYQLDLQVACCYIPVAERCWGDLRKKEVHNITEIDRQSVYCNHQASLKLHLLTYWQCAQKCIRIKVIAVEQRQINYKEYNIRNNLQSATKHNKFTKASKLMLIYGYGSSSFTHERMWAAMLHLVHK